MSWIEAIDRYPGRVVQRAGYSVKTVTALEALQYTRGERTLSLDAVLVDRTRELGRTWLVMPTYALAITMPRVLRWDDGEMVASEAVSTIKEEISAALHEMGRRHFYTTDEDDR